jgi:hypothetical protein
MIPTASVGCGLELSGFLASVARLDSGSTEPRRGERLLLDHACNLWEAGVSIGTRDDRRTPMLAVVPGLIGEAAKDHPQPDEEIVRRVLAGEKALYEVLMRRHNRKPRPSRALDL